MSFKKEWKQSFPFKVLKRLNSLDSGNPGLFKDDEDDKDDEGDIINAHDFFGEHETIADEEEENKERTDSPIQTVPTNFMFQVVKIPKRYRYYG